MQKNETSHKSDTLESGRAAATFHIRCECTADGERQTGRTAAGDATGGAAGTDSQRSAPPAPVQTYRSHVRDEASDSYYGICVREIRTGMVVGIHNNRAFAKFVRSNIENLKFRINNANLMLHNEGNPTWLRFACAALRSVTMRSRTGTQTRIVTERNATHEKHPCGAGFSISLRSTSKRKSEI